MIFPPYSTVETLYWTEKESRTQDLTLFCFTYANSHQCQWKNCKCNEQRIDTIMNNLKILFWANILWKETTFLAAFQKEKKFQLYHSCHVSVTWHAFLPCLIDCNVHRESGRNSTRLKLTPPVLASLARSTSDPESPSPIYREDCHFVSAIILVQGDTTLWQAAVTLLNIVSLCDWQMTISWHCHTHVLLGSPVTGCLLPLDQEGLQYLHLSTIHTCVYSIQ